MAQNTNRARTIKLRSGLADLPMVSKRIDYSSHAPAMLVSDRLSDSSSGSNCPQHHPYGSTAKGLGANVSMVGKLIGDPKRWTTYGRPLCVRDPANKLSIREHLPAGVTANPMSASGRRSGCALIQNVHFHRVAFYAIHLHRFNRLRLVDALKERLRVRAAEHGHSVEAEAREILQNAVGLSSADLLPKRTGADLVARIRARFEPLGGVELELLPRHGRGESA